MTSDEDFILYDTEPLGSCGRADQIGRAHSDEAESSQKPYSTGAGEGGDEYSEEQNFGLQNKALEGLHGVNEGIDGRLMGIQSQNMMVGINGGGVRLHRRSSAHGKRRDREETSDGGTTGYCKKSGKLSSDVGMAGGCKKDREEWSDGAISCLLDAYTEKYLQLNRGNLRGNDWDEVATMVSERSDGQKPVKTVDQCKNKVDSLKKRYKTEKSRGMVGTTGVTLSYWPWFKKVDQIAGSGAKLNVLSDDEKERVSASVGIVAAPPPPPPSQPPPPTSSKIPAIASPLPHQNSGGNNMTLPMQQAAPNRRLQGPMPVSLGFPNTPKKAITAIRWKRVLLKVSGRSLVGETLNVDPEILSLIAREIASVTRLGIEVAIVVGGGNFFNGSSWVSSGGLDRTAADHAGMMATVMNSILLQAALENEGVPTRIQTAFKFVGIAESYGRYKAIRHLEKGRVVIFGAGIGNPFFTTDAAAALRADEINADVVMKGTNVHGIYDGDPKINSEAIFYEHLSYQDALAKGSPIIDITAVTHCQEKGIPVVVFLLNEPGNISKALIGDRIGTLVDQNGPPSLYQ